MLFRSELRERDWGIYTGMAVAEAAEKYKIDGIWRFPDSSAETDKEILQRAGNALRHLAEKYATDTIIVVTHGQFARNMFAHHLKCDYHEIPSFTNAEIRLLTI